MRLSAACLCASITPGLKRPDKELIRAYLQRTSGYSRAQLDRLILQYLDCGRLVLRYATPQAGFARIYIETDVRLLAEIDTMHGTMSGPAIYAWTASIRAIRTALRVSTTSMPWTA